MPEPIEEGQEFVGFAAFSVATQDWAVRGAQKFAIRYQKSYVTRNVVICAQQDCPFRITNKTLGCVKAIKLKDEHMRGRTAAGLGHSQ